MTASQKTALSLLITVLLFAAFAAIAFTGLFDIVEARFHNPTITTLMTREITANTEVINNFFTEMNDRFSQALREPAVQRSFLINQSAEDIFERSRIFGVLHESLVGLQWVRFIDYGGLRIHFSTYAPDILTQDPLFMAYRNFNEPNFPYEAIAVRDGGAPRFTLDGEGDRILFSLPFYDYFEIYRGTALFSLSVRALSDMLIREGRLHAGHDILVISNPPGFLSGAPAAFVEEALVSQVGSIWRDSAPNIARLYSQETGISLTLLSVRNPQGFFVGRLVDNELFLFPQIMRIILLLSFFLTVYLTIFLLFNLKQDPVTIIQSRMKKLQLSLIEQRYEHKNDIDWSRWNRELEQRRQEISAQLKRGIRITSDKKAKDIDTIIDKSWDELILAIRGFNEPAIDEAKLQLILTRFLAANSSVRAGTPAGKASFYEAKDVEDIEELEEVELAEEVEELEEIEAAEAVEELEEIETEEVVENIEELEEIEEVEELEEPEELEELADESAADNTSNTPEIDIAQVASAIEFSSTPEPESADDKEDMWESFEVVSPFSSTLANLDNSHNSNDDSEENMTANNTAEEILEELSEATDESSASELLPISEYNKDNSKKKALNGQDSPQS